MENKTDALSVIIDKAGILDETKVILHSAFGQFYEQVNEIKAMSNDLIVTSETQTDLMKQARELRLKLVKVRTKGINEKHKELKADSLKYSNLLDEIKRTATSEIESVEAFLETQEKFAETKEAERKAAMKLEREALLKPFEVDTLYWDLATMPEENFQKLLKDSELAFNARVAEAKRLEDERIENERKARVFRERHFEITPYLHFATEDEIITLDTTNEEYESVLNLLLERKKEYDAEQERIRVENERLKAEAEKKDVILKQRNTELRPYIAFIRDYQAVLDMNEDDYQNELKVLNQAAMDQAKHDEEQRKKKEEEDAKISQRLAEQQREKDRIAAENKRLADELEAKEKAEQDRKDKEAADEEARLSMGDTEKFDALIADIQALIGKYEFKSAKFKKAKADVETLLQKTIEHANSKK